MKTRSAKAAILLGLLCVVCGVRIGLWTYRRGKLRSAATSDFAVAIQQWDEEWAEGDCDAGKALEGLVAEAQSRGADVVPVLVARCLEERGAVATLGARREAIIEALRELGTEDARAALLELASTTLAPDCGMSRKAALAFAYLATTTDERVKLLRGTPNAQLVGMGVLPRDKLTGHAVQELFRQFGVGSPFMGASPVSTDIQVILAGCLGRDPGSAAARAKCIGVLDIGVELARMMANGGDVAGHTWMVCSHSDMAGYERAYRWHVEAMSRFPGARGFLKEQYAASQGHRRVMCMLALGFAGEDSVRDDLLEFIDSSETSALRSFAVEALGGVARASDVPFLQKLREETSSSRQSNVPKAQRSRKEAREERARSLVRGAARTAIRNYEKRRGQGGDEPD